jgi:hypothetical protein
LLRFFVLRQRNEEEQFKDIVVKTLKRRQRNEEEKHLLYRCILLLRKQEFLINDL